MHDIEKNASRRLIAILMLTALLSSCAAAPGSPRKAGAAGSAGSEDGQEITLADSLEKHRLSIAYSVNRVRGGEEDLLRLTLIFRNLDSRDRQIRPHIALTDAQGNPVRVLGHGELTRLAAGSRKRQEALADVHWLNPSYRIPAQGIEIGELVYRGTDFNFPLKLVVGEARDRFEFQVESR